MTELKDSPYLSSDRLNQAQVRSSPFVAFYKSGQSIITREPIENSRQMI